MVIKPIKDITNIIVTKSIIKIIIIKILIEPIITVNIIIIQTYYYVYIINLGSSKESVINYKTKKGSNLKGFIKSRLD